jgi:hypothetical protein
LALLPADGDQQGDEGEAALQAEDDADEADDTADDDLDESPEQGEPGDEDEEVESDETQDESEDETPPDDATIEIDGTAVPVEEVKKGYLRQADYTRKTQALAEERKSFAEHAEAVRVERAQYSQLLSALQQQLTEGDEGEPDWDKLYEHDPIEAVKLERVYRNRREQREAKLAAIAAENERLAQVHEREQAEHVQRVLVGEREALLKAIPAWKDPKVAKAERAKVKAFAVSIGFSEDELAQVTDHRAVLGLRMAMKYAELSAKRQQGTPPVTPKVRPMRPGAPADSKSPRRAEIVQAKQRLAKSGSVKDAAANILHLL